MSRPYPPTNLTATAVDESTINLFWHNPSAFDDVISIERKSGEYGATYADLVTLSGTDESYSDNSCVMGTLYYYRVQGSSDDGFGTITWSLFSNEASAVTVLPAPTDLTGVALSASEIELSWDDNSVNETGFEVYILEPDSNFYAYVDVTDANEETYVKTGLEENTLYYFKVRAVNSDISPAYIHSDFSNEIHLSTKDEEDPEPGITLENNGLQYVLIIDKVSVLADNPDIIVIPIVVPSDVLTRRFEVIATDSAVHKVGEKIGAEHSDNGFPVSSYIRTKDLDFTDQHPDLAGITKTLKKFRLIYEDVDAGTPVTVYISNNGGAHWGTSVINLGTGDGKVKFADFYFMDSEYVTGLNFTFKVESLSTTNNFLWLAFELEFMTRGESFNVTPTVGSSRVLPD